MRGSLMDRKIERGCTKPAARNSIFGHTRCGQEEIRGGCAGTGTGTLVQVRRCRSEGAALQLRQRAAIPRTGRACSAPLARNEEFGPTLKHRTRSPKKLIRSVETSHSRTRSLLMGTNTAGREGSLICEGRVVLEGWEVVHRAEVGGQEAEDFGNRATGADCEGYADGCGIYCDRARLREFAREIGAGKGTGIDWYRASAFPG
jgi:hypothetical protein